MPPNSSPTFTPHTPTSLVQLLVYKPCSVFSFLLLRLTLFKKNKKFIIYNYSCSDSTAFCIASISFASFFFLRFTCSDPFSAVPQPFFIAMHLLHEVLLPSLLKSAVKSREHWVFTYLLQTHSLPAFTHLQQLLFSTSSSENPLFFSCDPDASCGSASADHPCLSASRWANSARILCRSSTLSVLLSSECCICGWLCWLWFKLCIPTNPQVQLYIPTDHVHTLRPQGSALRGKYRI